MRHLLVVAMCTLCALAYPQTTQFILDGEDTVLDVQPGWNLEKTGFIYLGSFRFGIVGPGTGSRLATWTIDGVPSGTYLVEFYCDNAANSSAAEYIVEHDGGATTLSLSQNNVGLGWHPIGTFAFTNAGRITQTDRNLASGERIIADALRLTYQGTPQPETVNVVPPEISFCIDDMGATNPNDSGSACGQLFAACPDFTYAVMPAQAYGTATLQAAQTAGIDVILHQAMQYVGQVDYNASDPTRLYIGMTDAQILSCLRTNLNAQEPYIQGMNQHQGSRFSQVAHGLDIVLGELRTRGYWVYDSRTITDSVMYDMARQSGMLCGERDLFVDGASTAQDTIDLYMSLGRRAYYQPNYQYLAIGHPRPASVPGFVQAQTQLASIGVGIRRLKRNLHYIVEADNLPTGANFTKTGPWVSTNDDMMSHECGNGIAWALAGGNAGTATFTPNLPREGDYRVFVGFGKGTNQGVAHVSVSHSNGTATKDIDQAVSPNRWHYVGKYAFAAGSAGNVQIDNAANPSATNLIQADAVKWVYDGPPTAGIEDALEY